MTIEISRDGVNWSRHGVFGTISGAHAELMRLRSAGWNVRVINAAGEIIS